jgi:hypothetical protein
MPTKVLSCPVSIWRSTDPQTMACPAATDGVGCDLEHAERIAERSATAAARHRAAARLSVRSWCSVVISGSCLVTA